MCPALCTDVDLVLWSPGNWVSYNLMVTLFVFSEKKKKNRPGTLGGRQMIKLKDFCGGIILIFLFNLSSALLGAPEFGFREGAWQQELRTRPILWVGMPEVSFVSSSAHWGACLSQMRLRRLRENAEHLCNSGLACLAWRSRSSRESNGGWRED